MEVNNGEAIPTVEAIGVDEDGGEVAVSSFVAWMDCKCCSLLFPQALWT